VPSFRLDHEQVEVREEVSPFRPRPATATTPARPLADITADRWVPLWGIGLGNDFGHMNETYLSASTGWRPLRYFDVVSPFSATFVPGQPSDPFTSLDIEAGVHGTPITGLWYDVGLFWMEFDNRTESQFLNPGVNTDTILSNSGSTRHRGFEGEISYDVLALWDEPSLKERHLTVGGNLQLLDAEFSESTVIAGGKSIVGNQPAFAPEVVGKWALTYRDKRANLSLSGVYVSSQYWQDSNLPATGAGGVVTIPAQVPSYLVWNFTGQYDVTKNVTILAGISNLADERYYSRVFGNGLEPAPGRTAYAGLRVKF
jgi:Fe(3+) dicitrate transport protein